MIREPSPLVPLGATLQPDGVHFSVWAAHAQSVDLVLKNEDRTLPMLRGERGYYTLNVPSIGSGTRYQYRLHLADGVRDLPDPASRSQPDGVHGDSEVIDLMFAWTDTGWTPPPLREMIFYELHIGTFTPDGTFDAVIPQLPRLVELGVNAIELMPVAQCPGARNWGYDGVYPFAVQNNYGGAAGLQRLVDACHQHGITVALDVIYNHFGPEGNYFSVYAPYTTDHYRSPWGDGMNFDDAGSDEVRRFFIDNALHWIEHFHIDALRIDAADHLLDFSPVPILKELTATVHEWADLHNRRVYVIAEHDRADVNVTRPAQDGGTGLDAQWLDDFHHCLHVLLTGDIHSYYVDYQPPAALLIECMRDGFVYAGEYSPFRQRRQGTSGKGIAADRFVVFSQNHDQVGNRLKGDRMSAMTDIAGCKLAAAVVLLSPYTPLLFMGEEYGEDAPFLFFVSHSDPALIKATQEGRAGYFGFAEQAPDPQAEETFQKSKLNPELRHTGDHADLYQLYKDLIALRKRHPALQSPNRDDMDIRAEGENGTVMTMYRRIGRTDGVDAVFSVFNLDMSNPVTITLNPPALPGSWHAELTSHEPLNDEQIGASLTVTLPPKGFIVYTHEVQS